MFNLKNTENDIELDLRIVGYQFPDALEDNWCLLKAAVRQGEKFIDISDPALEADDIVSILSWFVRLSEHKLPRFGLLSFIEPCIEFEFLACDKYSVRISVNLNNEMKPNFELSQFGITSNNWNIVFDLNEDDFKSIIAGIEEAMQQYPVRVKPNNLKHSDSVNAAGV